MTIQSNDVVLPSEAVFEKNKEFADSTPNYKETRGKRHCSGPKTSVLYLAYQDGRAIEAAYYRNSYVNPNEVEIRAGEVDDTYEDEYILSSTRAVIEDPRYQMDCWAKVGGVDIGELRKSDSDNNKFKVIYYTQKNQTDSIYVTPQHRFYIKASGNSAQTWMAANNLVPGMLLFNNEREETCTVNSVRDFIPEDTKVYNPILPETLSYYVGRSVENKVYVHNMKVY